MRTVVFTPTCRPGGLDVAFASIRRQHRPDLVWIVGDELLARRAHAYDAAPCEVLLFDTSLLRTSGQPFTLAAAYRHAMKAARDMHADLFISMQDYIWAPPGGVDAFVRLAEEHPRSLLSGLCSLSSDPGVEEITDPDGLYSIFASPFTRKPKHISWRDCRTEMYHEPISPMAPSSWETNWAAIPRELLHRDGLDFDPVYDRGHAYENQGYAAAAFKLGYDAWIDLSNEAIGLPHKQYFLIEEARMEALNNRAWHERRLWEVGVTQR